MLRTSKPLRALIALSAMAASMFVAQLALPGTAHARCAGENQPVLMKLVYDNVTPASEETITGSGNGLHRGKFRSHSSDYTAYLLWRDDGEWTQIQNSTTTFQEFQFYDDNSHTRIMLCVEKHSTGWWTCGYDTTTNVSASGPNDDYHAVNEGF